MRPLALVGPTASGKTTAGIELARRFDAEILVVDSMTVYRGMDLGTAKPSATERAEVPHHLLDLADPTEPFTVALFQSLARSALAEVSSRGRPALLVGGSGLYYRAVVDDLRFPGTDPEVRSALAAEAAVLGPADMYRRVVQADPEAARKMDPANARRSIRALEVMAITGAPFSAFGEAWDRYPESRVRAAGVEMDPEDLAARIEDRLRRQIREGLLEEVAELIDRGFGPFLTASQAIPYAEIADHLRGRSTLEEALSAGVRRTRRLARRQMAWFRRDPRVEWFRAGPEGATGLVDEIEEYLKT